jgi:hypothetical protein
MIGTSSFLLESGVVLALVAMFLGCLFYAIAKKQRGVLVVAGGVLIMLALMGTRFWFQVANHGVLASLTTNDVAAIRISGRTVTEPVDLERIVSALKDKQWFSSNHGGWDKPVWMGLIRTDGTTNRFLVGYYTRQEGAVIEFGRSGRFGRWSDGYAFSESLPAALKQAGVSLSTNSAK